MIGLPRRQGSFEQPNPQEIVATLESNGFERESTLILGSGVLAIMGIRRANDVDIMVPHVVYQDIERHRSTPNGTRWVHPKDRTTRPFLETSTVNLEPGTLPIDLTYAYRLPDSPPLTYDEFTAKIKEFPEHDGYKHLPPEVVLDIKKDYPHERKHRHDVKLIEDHLKRQAG